MGKKGKGSVAAGHPFDLSAFESPEMDFKSTVEHIRSMDNARVHLAFFKREQNINPGDFPKEDKIAREMMYNLSVALNKAVVRADLEEAQKDLEKMQSDLEKMDRREEKLSDKAGKQADRAIKAQKDVGRLEKKLDREKDKLESLQMEYGPNPSAKELGKIANMQKKVEKLERDIEKKKEDVLDYQKKEAELETSDLPDQRAERKDLVREIDTQKALVEALQKKTGRD